MSVNVVKNVTIKNTCEGLSVRNNVVTLTVEYNTNNDENLVQSKYKPED